MSRYVFIYGCLCRGDAGLSLCRQETRSLESATWPEVTGFLLQDRDRVLFQNFPQYHKASVWPLANSSEGDEQISPVIANRSLQIRGVLLCWSTIPVERTIYIKA